MNWRKIVVDGREWKYFVGQQNVVAKAIDNDESRVIDFPELSGISANEVDRGKWKRWFHVTPSMINRWLSGNLPR